MLHQNALLHSRVTKLKEQLQVVTKRKTRKRKQIQKGGTLEYSKGATQVAAKAFAALQSLKKAYSREGQDGAQRALQRCGNYRGTGYNARTCQVAEEESSKSDASTQYSFLCSSADSLEETESSDSSAKKFPATRWYRPLGGRIR